MKLTVLGMNGPFPAPDGATSGYLLESGDTRVQLDLGCGTLAELTKRMPPEELDALVLSHWHSDHCSDALPLLYRLQSRAKKPLEVYGPEDSASPVRAALAADPAIRLHTIAPGDTLCIGALRLTVGQARHPVPAVTERWEDNAHTLFFTGDTNTVPGLAEGCRGADLLLADGLFPAEMWAEGKPHLSAVLCAELARDAGCRALLLTHMNPDLDAEAILAEAREIYPEAMLACPGFVWQA